MEKSKIIVSNPCNKDWSKMSHTENGRHCISCNKTVVDFTNWELEDINQYLKQKNENICGHFKSLHVKVKRPRHHEFLVDAYFKIENNFKSTFVKSLMLSSIVAIMFLVGCNNPNEGKTTGSIPIHDFESVDTLPPNPSNEGRTTGEVSIHDFDSKDTLPSNDTMSYQKVNKKK
jgi:hypothetical protein